MEKIGDLELSNSPNERFVLNVLGVTYNCTQLWNSEGFWTISISDTEGIDIVLGARLVSGLFILKQFPVLDFDFYIDATVDPGRESFPDLKVGIYAK